MPLYEHKLTGKTAVLTVEQAAVYPEGVWTKVEDEAPSERRERERLEAQERKVDVDTAEEEAGNPPASKTTAKTAAKSKKGN